MGKKNASYSLSPSARMYIENLRLRAIIGANDWEREQKQDVVISITVDFNPTAVIASDNLVDTVNYKAMKKRVMALVEASAFFMIEKMAAAIIDAVMRDPLVTSTTVRVAKPGALRFADNVWIELSAQRPR
jgi:FolB domain-containing protein